MPKTNKENGSASLILLYSPLYMYRFSHPRAKTPAQMPISPN